MRENNNQYENSKKITSKKITRDPGDIYGYPPAASALDKGITVDIYSYPPASALVGTTILKVDRITGDHSK